MVKHPLSVLTLSFFSMKAQLDTFNTVKPWEGSLTACEVHADLADVSRVHTSGAWN